MKAKIVHESSARLRVKLARPLTVREADLMQAWLSRESGAESVTVHERTGCVIFAYAPGGRDGCLAALGRFSFASAESSVTLPGQSLREINRAFAEKLVRKVLMKAAGTLFLPIPLRKFRAAMHMLPFMRRGLGCIWRRRMKVELLDAISIGVSAFRGDFGTAGSVMFLLELGELLEEWTHKKSVAGLAESLSLNVDRVWLRSEDGDRLVPIAQIRPGDRVVIRAGGMIPMDGVVCSGEASVNQASLTGESIPVAKRPGGVVYAGTVVEEGECVVEVRQGLGESRYDRIVEMIERSEKLKSATEAKAASLADRLVPWTFAGSLLSFVLTRNVQRAVSVLMVDFSCALKLAMPLAVLSAMGEAGRAHITVKGGKFLEAVAEADTIVFDKTGTLTHACPRVARIDTFCGKDEEEMLRLAACLEEHFPHSMANAVVEEARRRGLTHEEYHSKVDYIVAHGVASTVSGIWALPEGKTERVLIGSAHFIFEDEKCIVPEDERGRFDALPAEYSQLYLAIDGRLAAVISISDPLREEAREVLAALRRLGIKEAVMLTGDSPRTAEAIAKQLGVDTLRAGVLPSDKARFVARRRAEGHRVIMVGDGINDSPALSEADCGIAISDGAAIAREIADVTIAADSLWELVRLRRIAMALMARIKANYRFVIGFNAALIALGAAGILPPAASALLHNLSTLGVSLHSMGRLAERD
ncbi:MAG TPA: heavy metal translocating P-type ATPase [Candidatus Scatomorpha stercorigallinarum]|nr:heavy metal translocating P-type ATPase [Candidatus Scatomorpha stercorigallinarum]